MAVIWLYGVCLQRDVATALSREHCGRCISNNIFEVSPRNFFIKCYYSDPFWIRGSRLCCGQFTVDSRCPRTLSVQGPVTAVGEICVRGGGPAPRRSCRVCVSYASACYAVSTGDCLLVRVRMPV